MDAASTINITSNGTAVLRVTWSNGRGSAVFTNNCPYTVLAEPPSDPAPSLSSTAAAIPPATASMLLPAALLLLGLLLLGYPRLVVAVIPSQLIHGPFLALPRKTGKHGSLAITTNRLLSIVACYEGVAPYSNIRVTARSDASCGNSFTLRRLMRSC